MRRGGLGRTSGLAPCPGGVRPRSHHAGHRRAPGTRLPAVHRTIDMGCVDGVPRVEAHYCTTAGNPKLVSSPSPLWYSRVPCVLIWSPLWSTAPSVLRALVGDGSPPSSHRHSVGTMLLVRMVALTIIPGLSSERRLPLQGRLFIVPPPNLLGRHWAAGEFGTHHGDVFPPRSPPWGPSSRVFSAELCGTGRCGLPVVAPRRRLWGVRARILLDFRQRTCGQLPRSRLSVAWRHCPRRLCGN